MKSNQKVKTKLKFKPCSQRASSRPRGSGCAHVVGYSAQVAWAFGSCHPVPAVPLLRLKLGVVLTQPHGPLYLDSTSFYTLKGNLNLYQSQVHLICTKRTTLPNQPVAALWPQGSTKGQGPVKWSRKTPFWYLQPHRKNHWQIMAFPQQDAFRHNPSFLQKSIISLLQPCTSVQPDPDSSASRSFLMSPCTCASKWLLNPPSPRSASCYF